MTIIATRLTGPATLANAPAVIYTAPASSIVFIQSAVFANTDATGIHTITVYVVPSGGGIGAATTVVPKQSISPSSTYKSSELAGVVMNPGDTIEASADTAALVTYTISGFVMGSSGT